MTEWELLTQNSSYNGATPWPGRQRSPQCSLSMYYSLLTGMGKVHIFNSNLNGPNSSSLCLSINLQFLSPCLSSLYFSRSPFLSLCLSLSQSICYSVYSLSFYFYLLKHFRSLYILSLSHAYSLTLSVALVTAIQTQEEIFWMFDMIDENKNTASVHERFMKQLDCKCSYAKKNLFCFTHFAFSVQQSNVYRQYLNIPPLPSAALKRKRKNLTIWQVVK